MARRRGSDEDGITLVELLVAITVMTVILGVTATTVVAGMQNQRRQLDHVHQLNDVKTAFERVTREIRAADPLVTGDGEHIEVLVRRDGECVTFGFALEEQDNGLAMLRNTENNHILARDLDYQAGEAFLTYYSAEDPNTALAEGFDPEDVATVRMRMRAAINDGEHHVDLDNRIMLRNQGVATCPED